jgi:hypothetical protein
MGGISQFDAGTLEPCQAVTVTLTLSGSVTLGEIGATEILTILTGFNLGSLEACIKISISYGEILTILLARAKP